MRYSCRQTPAIAKKANVAGAQISPIIELRIQYKIPIKKKKKEYSIRFIKAIKRNKHQRTC